MTFHYYLKPDKKDRNREREGGREKKKDCERRREGKRERERDIFDGTFISTKTGRHFLELFTHAKVRLVYDLYTS